MSRVSLTSVTLALEAEVMTVYISTMTLFTKTPTRALLFYLPVISAIRATDGFSAQWNESQIEEEGRSRGERI